MSLIDSMVAGVLGDEFQRTSNGRSGFGVASLSSVTLEMVSWWVWREAAMAVFGNGVSSSSARTVAMFQLLESRINLSGSMEAVEVFQAGLVQTIAHLSQARGVFSAATVGNKVLFG